MIALYKLSAVIFNGFFLYTLDDLTSIFSLVVGSSRSKSRVLLLL